MKYAVALALLILAGCVGAHPRDIEANPRKHALRLVMGMEGAVAVCGATKVGPDTIETATHCLHLPLLTVDGVPVQIVRSERIGRDRMRLVVSGVRFDSWASMGTTAVGERVRWWGHPLRLSFVYREGRVAFVADEGVAVDATICFGDSGSGLFNDAGELVGVISAMTDLSGCTFMVAY